MWYHQLDDIHPVLQKQPKAATNIMSKEAKELCQLEHSQYNNHIALYMARFNNRNWFWLLDLVLKKVGLKLEGIMVKFNSLEARVSVLCEWLWIVWQWVEFDLRVWDWVQVMSQVRVESMDLFAKMSRTPELWVSSSSLKPGLKLKYHLPK